MEKSPRTGMMYTRSDYLRFSQQCVLISRRVSAPEHRKFLLDMAESWRKLADSAGDKVDRDGFNGMPVNED